MGGTKHEVSLKAIASVMYVPFELIAPAPHRPGSSLSAEEVAELTSSIPAVGKIEPLIVRPDGDDRGIPTASRLRLSSVPGAGLSEIHAIVRHELTNEYFRLAPPELSNATPFL